MKKLIVIVAYAIMIVLVITFMLMHLVGIHKMNNLNFTLLLVFGIFNTMVFGELVLKDYSRDKNKRI